MCNFLGSVLSQQKFEATDVKPLGASQLFKSVIAPCNSSVLFGKYILEGVRACQPKRRKEKRGRERERESECTHMGETPPALWFLFYMFFSLPLGLPHVNWASQECCLFYLRSSLRSSDLPLFYLCGLYPSLS